MSKKTLERKNHWQKIASFIVQKRNLFFLLYIFAAIFCLFSLTWVQVENDVTVYLDEDSETRQGLEAMNSNFVMTGTAQVMVSNVTLETAYSLSEKLSSIENITMVTFENSPTYYKDASALFDVTFSTPVNDPQTLQGLQTIKDILTGYDFYINTTIGVDDNAMLAEEMAVIGIVAVIIIFIVLTLTSSAYAEVLVLLMTFGAAALMNLGTHYLLGKISFISNSVAVVLQLALAIDYAVILCHRFNAERDLGLSPVQAASAALAKAIPEISASSLTTISGLGALAFMHFRVGLDMSLVLMKSILLSLLSVFTLMPGLLVLFSPLLEKTKHRKLLPDVSFLGRFAVKSRKIMPPIFCFILIGAFILSSMCPYCYTYNNLRMPKMTEQQVAAFKIKDTFGENNLVAIIVPRGDYEAEKMLLAELSAQPEVKSTMGLANIEIAEGLTLTDALTARELSEFIGLDYEVTQALYSAYALDQNQQGVVISGIDDYRVPLFDMIIFLMDQMESRNIELELGGDMGDMTSMLGQLESARSQMQSENYSRMVVYLSLPEEGEETFAFLSEMRDIIGKYYEGDYYIVGNSTSCRDLSATFSGDNLLISILSAFFVILVLLFTFQSAGLPVLLILVIQGSIWINFSFPILLEQPLYFLGYLIVSALQMGANIDYAIVISSHYQEQKKHMPHKEAIVHAVNSAFPTIFTSGTMMAAAGLLIGNLSAQPVVSIMGTCIGRGTIISIILVLFVLPSILVLGDSIIERTRFKMKGIELPTRQVAGTVHVKGHLRGYISGIVDADFEGLLHGQLNASVSTETQIQVEEDTAEPAPEDSTPTDPTPEESAPEGGEQDA